MISRQTNTSRKISKTTLKSDAMSLPQLIGNKLCPEPNSNPSSKLHPPGYLTAHLRVKVQTRSVGKSNFFLNQRPNAQLEPRNRDMGCRNTESSTHERTMHSNGGQYPSPHVEDDREDNGFGRPGPSTNTQPGQQVPSTTRISSNMFPTQGPTTQLDPRRRETGSQKTEYSTYERTMHSNGGRYSARNVEGYPEVDDFSRTGPSTSSQPRHHIPTSLTTRTNSQPWQHVPNSWTSTANSQPQRQVLAPRTTRANSQPQQHNPPTWTTGESSYSFSGDQMTNSQPEVGEEDPLTCEGIITKNGARCLVPCTDHADLQEDGRYFCPKHDPRLQCHGLAITQKNRQCRRTCDPKKDHKIGNYYYCNLHSPLNKHLMCNGTKTNGEPCRYRETEVYNGMRYCKYHKHQIGY
ncbi:hypothetical protein B0O80DRAFT_240897 [Mortierella sp. GBAus27b]|nr:hypothetical protein B0O80DRAFT_240897 [Mortierella sp. GBAus27b]